jgi:hypothetical protein
MLIEQILKEAEAIRDIFQLFNQYPEYQRLFTQQYQILLLNLTKIQLGAS